MLLDMLIDGPRRTLAAVLAALLVVSTAGCDLSVSNPNNASEEQVLTTAEGVQALAVGLQAYYATTLLSPAILVPGVSSREVAINTTFANLVELEAGGTGLAPDNGSILQLWSRAYRTVSIADDVIDNAGVVEDEATRSGLVALARLYKAMALGVVAQNFEQGPLAAPASGDAAFVPRDELLAEAIRLLDAAQQGLNATPPSGLFLNDVLAPGFDLRNTIQTYRARYNLFAGNYAAAVAAADAVVAGATSLFPYDDQGQNPIFNQIVVAEDYAPRDLFGTLLTNPDDGRLAFYMDALDTLSTPNEYPINAIGGFFTMASQPIPAYVPGELPLIRAEAFVRTGDLDAAVAEIDVVRTKTAEADPLGLGAGLAPYDGPVTAEALLAEIFQQRRAELFMQGFGLEDARRLNRPGPDPDDPFARTRNFYPYPAQERLNNPNTPPDPAI